MAHRILDLPAARPAAAGLLLSLLCAGCGKSEELPLAEVTGVITLDGKPVGGAGIEFIPQEPGKSVAYGRSDEDGHYRMHFGQSRTGAFVGRNLVRIYSDDRVTHDGRKYEGTELFPPKYNVKSEQYVEVVGGNNEIDFKCESGEFKARQAPATESAGT